MAAREQPRDVVLLVAVGFVAELALDARLHHFAPRLQRPLLVGRREQLLLLLHHLVRHHGRRRLHRYC